jgi:hypothetical protein
MPHDYQAEKEAAKSDPGLIPIHIGDWERMTRIGRDTLLGEIRGGRLAACKISRSWYITRAQFAAWLKRVESPARES